MYGVLVAVVTHRAHIEGGGRTVVEYRHDPRYGQHRTRAAAKAAYMRALEPELADAPEAFAARHFDQRARNIGDVKIGRRVNDVNEAHQAMERDAGIRQH